MKVKVKQNKKKVKVQQDKKKVKAQWTSSTEIWKCKPDSWGISHVHGEVFSENWFKLISYFLDHQYHH